MYIPPPAAYTNTIHNTKIKCLQWLKSRYQTLLIQIAHLNSSSKFRELITLLSTHCNDDTAHEQLNNCERKLIKGIEQMW